MKHYARYGFTEFVLALGHKGDQIKRYFLDYRSLGNDLTISLQNGGVTPRTDTIEPWTVHLIDTGDATLTGGRLKHIAPLIQDGTFMLTYGDGVSNVPLDRLLAFHRSRGALVTLTAVRPPARFGALEFDGDDRIRHFKEKSVLHEAWINGGFSVVEPHALDYITSDVMWEHAPLEALASEGRLVAYRHEEFWQCMDTLRDLRYLEELWEAGQPPWRTW